MDEMQNWLYEQKYRKWQSEYFPQIRHTSTHYIIHQRTTATNNGRPDRNRNAQNVRAPVADFNAKAKVPSVVKRVLAEFIGEASQFRNAISSNRILDSFIIIAVRVFCLLLYYTEFNFAEIFSPSPDTVEQILNDLTSSIVLQSAILDERDRLF